MSLLKPTTAIFGKVIFRGEVCFVTEARIPVNERVAGINYYDIRGDDDEWEPATIEPSVIVNHSGTLVTKAMLQFEDPKDPCIELTEDERCDIAAAYAVSELSWNEIEWTA